jgi:hypothetical protein
VQKSRVRKNVIVCFNHYLANNIIVFWNIYYIVTGQFTQVGISWPPGHVESAVILCWLNARLCKSINECFITLFLSYKTNMVSLILLLYFSFNCCVILVMGLKEEDVAMWQVLWLKKRRRE